MYEAELEHILSNKHKQLEYYALQITGDLPLAQDVVQGAAFDMWRNLAQFDPTKSSLYTWLVRKVLRRARVYVARTSQQFKQLTSLEEIHSSAEIDHNVGEAKEILGVDVRTAIKTLPSSLRWVAEESLIKRTPILDLSISSGIHKRVLYKWLTRARRILRESLKEYK